MASIFIQQLSHSNWQEWIAHSGKIPVRLSGNKLFSKANWAGDEGNQTFRWNDRFNKQGILQKTSTHPCQSRLPEASRLGMTTENLETSLISEYLYGHIHTLTAGRKRPKKPLESLAMRLSCLFLPWDLGGFSSEFWLCLDAEAKANDERSPWLDFWVALKFPRKAIPAKILGAVRGYKTKWYWMNLPGCFMRLSYTILLDNYHFVMNPEEEVECIF